MKPPVDDTVHRILNEQLSEIEKYFGGDVLTYYGPIINGTETKILKLIEDLQEDRKEKLYVIVTTNGGSAHTVERYVNIFRHHYSEVNFIVPDYAYSAGTILCMSGDSIHMDYHSVLGPIDPQVQNKDGKWVPALGYLDKVNSLIEKSKAGTLTNAEFLMLKELDLAELRDYEQAKNLTIDLLENWLVNYKFKNWDKHRTDPVLIGQAVTDLQKKTRAKEIATALSDNGKWKSHSRPINIDALKELRLEINDFSHEPVIRPLIKEYHVLLQDYVEKYGFPSFGHTRRFI